MRAALLAAGLALALPLAVGAQGTVTLDRVVAVVGSRPILASQLEEQLVQQQAQGQQLPTDSAARQALRRQLLDQMIEEELVVQQAERDTTIKVTDQEVLDQVEQTVRNIRANYTSEADFQAQLKLAGFGTVEEWRRYLAESQRRSILFRRMIEQQQQKGKIKPIAPTEAQMRAFWETRRAQQPKRPATVSFRQIVIVPKADSVARARARQLADSLLGELRKGADFAALARKYSQDSATREAGGELGWFRRGMMVKPFEAVAFRLRPGELSDPVETTFGFHIIQVERIQPAEILARHILITPTISAEQIARARALADSIHDALQHSASFDDLARRYADEDEPKLAEGVALTDLPPEYQRLFAADTTLGLKPVVTIGEGTRRPKFAVIEVTKRQPAGDLAFDDVKDRIRTSLAQELAVQHYVDQLRHSTYVDVRL